MPPYLLLLVALAGVAVFAAGGRRRQPLVVRTVAGSRAGAAMHAVSRRPVPASGGSTPAPAESVGHPALVRSGRVGDAGQPGLRRVIASVAPIDDPSRALLVHDSDGTVVADIRIVDVAVARAWSRGELVAASGAADRSHGPTWPVGPNLAGWELQLVTDGGEVVRCYGSPLQGLSTDLERLRRRLKTAELAQAS